MRVLLGCLLFASFLSLACCHSWVQCVDYTEENGQLWDASKCRAYPRDFAEKFAQNSAFGADVGFNYQPSAAAACQQSPATAASYSAAFPAASYAPGQRVCLAWPPKNHVAAVCQNSYIPDAGTRIYSSGLNPTSDPTLDQFYQNLVFDFGANPPGPAGAGAGIGFQNCPNFCQNNDKALCTGCFNVSASLAPGKYTFLWEWDFNGPTDKYTTCWDVTISPSVTNTITSTLPHIGPDTYKSMLQASLTTSSVTGAGGTSSPSGTGGTGGASGGGDIYGPCPQGSFRCNCTVGGSCDKGLVCTSNLCVSASDVESLAGTKSNAGSIAAGVLLTFFGVLALIAAVVYFAREYPESTLGQWVMSATSKPTTHFSAVRRDPLLANAYVPNNS